MLKKTMPGWAMALGLCLVQVTPAWATISSFSITQNKSGGIVAPLNVVGDTVSGVGICPTNPSPGCDFSDTDALVRTHDIVEYGYSFNNVGTDNAVEITATAPLGMVWDTLPGFCGVGSSINNNPAPAPATANDGVLDASVIVCKIAAAQTNQSLVLPFRARVLGVPNGTNLKPTGSIKSTETAAIAATGPTNIVSAAPRFDLQKYNSGAAPTFGTFTSLNGTSITGYQVPYNIRLVLDSSTGTVIGGVPSTLGRVGSAPLDGTSFTFTELLSGLPAGSALISCATGNASGLDPLGTYSTTTPAQSVLTSGTLACSSTPPGTNSVATWSGLNTTLNHVPTNASNGSALVAGINYVALAFVKVVVPISSIPVGSTVASNNCLSGFDPNGGLNGGAPISNFLSNNEPGFTGTANNCASRSLTNVAGGGANKYLSSSPPSNATASQPPVPGILQRSGDGIVSPGATYSSWVELSNTGSTVLSNVQSCDVWDNRKQRLKPIASGAQAGKYAFFGYLGGGTTAATIAATVIEYNSGYATAGFPASTTFPNPAAIRAECGVTTGWVSDPTLVPGGLNAVTKVRVTSPVLLQGTELDLTMNFEALAADPATGIAWPANTVVPDWGVSRSDEWNTGWTTNSYNPGVYPGVHSNTSNNGDRVILQPAVVRVAKVTLNAAGTLADDSTNSVTAGGTVGYALKPSVTSTPGDTADVLVHDVLPAGFSYLGGSSTVGGTAFAPVEGVCTGANAPVPGCATAGQQTLSWNLGQQTANTTVPEIRFRAVVPVSVVNGANYANTAVVVSSKDGSAQVARTATRSVSAALPAGFLISKTVTPTLIEPGGNFSYTVSYANTSITALNQPDFIDILPANTDATGTWNAISEGRVPPTLFTGTRTLQSVTATTPDGIVLYVTNTPIASIDKAPSVVANLNPGTGASIWCRATITAGVVAVNAGQPAGCAGTTAATLTAIRLVDQDTSYPIADGARSFTLNFSTAGNVEGNLYTNDTGGFAASGIALPVISNDVTLTVIMSSIAGTVYRDDDNNGTQAVGESGIAGVTLTLCAVNTNPCPAASVKGTQVTDAAGAYKFTGIPSGTYHVFETQPAAYVSALANAPGSAGGTAVGTDGFTGITVGLGVKATGYNFGEKGVASIGTRKALNTAAVPVTGQPGVYDIPMRVAAKNFGTTALNSLSVTDTVCGPGGTFAAATACAIQVAPVVTVTGTGTVAATNGAAYTGLAAGNNLLATGAVLEVGGEVSIDFTVRVTFDAATTSLSFNNQAQSTATPSTGGATPINDLSNNGASYTGGADTDPTGASSNAPTPIAFAVLQGRVFIDNNNNGLFDGTDAAVPTAVTLNVSGGALAAAMPVTTNAAGQYFAVVPISATPYVIAETQPAGYQDGKEVVGTGALVAAAPAGSPLSAPAAGASGGVADAGTGSGVGADRYSAIVANTAGGIYGNFNFAELQTVAVSGTVFNDTNGLLGTPLNTVDGTGTNAATASLRAYLVQGGNVVASVPIDPVAGTYTFASVLPATGYTVVLANTPTVVAPGSAAPAPSLPAGWVNTGENIGAVAGSDGTVNGTSASFDVVATAVTQVNFGIEQPPTAGASVLPNQSNPGGTNTIAIAPGLFVGTLPTGATGTTATDPTAVTQIRITALPSNVTSITLNGTSYGSCGACTAFPGAGVTLTVAQLAGMVIDPIDGVVTPVIPYVALDDAGQPSGAGTVTIPLTFVNVSGTVFNDTNGLNGVPANTVDGTPTNAGSTTLTAYLVQGGNVVKSAVVSATGTYSISNVPAGAGYSVVLADTATPVAPGSPAPAASLPLGWVNTGENIGAAAGSDGTVNGTSATFAVVAADITQVNFGIEQPPASGSTTAASQPNPGGTATVPVPAGMFTGTLPATAVGTNATDPTAVTAIRITALPNSTTSITLNGTTYGTCPACTAFPAAGVTLTVAQLAGMVLDPVDGAVTPVIPYVAIDAAGKESTPGAVNLPLGALSLTGNVYNDTNGLLGTPVNTVDGTGTNAASTGLTAYLVQAGKVVASSPVASGGSYSINNVPVGTGYSVVLANTPTVVAPGATAPAASLPAGWVNTGENIGAGAGSDGTINGVSAAFDVVATSITNVNFGIEQPPVSGVAVAATQANPGGTTAVPVPAGLFTGPLPAGATGGNASDPTALAGIRLTALPSNTTSLTVAGVSYGTCPACVPFPVAGVPVSLAQLASLTLDPEDGAVTPVMPYVAVDAAGLESAPGSVSLPLSAVSVSGKVFNDTNGLLGTPANTVDGTGTNAGANNGNIIELRAYLVKGGLVVSQAPIAADGTYRINDVPLGTGYTVVLTSAFQDGFVSNGNPAPKPTLSYLQGSTINSPSDWVNTGENIGLGAGSDGTVDGISASFNVAASVTNVNFGIEQIPTAGDAVLPNAANPGGVLTLPIPAGAFIGPLPAGATGTTAQDSAGVSAVRITALPANVDSITVTIAGATTTYGTAPGATAFPAAGLVIPQASLASLKVDPKDNVNDILINYYPVDEAGQESKVAGSVKLPLTTVDLKLEKASVGGFVKTLQGEYSLKVTNVGSAASSGVITVTDTLPPGLTFVASSLSVTGAATNADVTCTAAAATATGQVVTCTSAPAYVLPSTGVINLGFKVAVAQTAGTACAAPLTGECVTNNAVVSLPSDGVPTNNSASVTTQLVTGPDLVLKKTALTNPMTINNPGQYRLDVSNIGPIAAPFVAPGAVLAPIVVTDTLPASLEYVSAQGTDWTCAVTGAAASGQTVSCTTKQSIAATNGQASPIILTVKPLPGLAKLNVLNQADVQGGGEPTANYDSTNATNNGTPKSNNNANVSVLVQEAASLTGTVWRDVDHDRQLGSASTEARVPGFIVEVVDPATGEIMGATTTDSKGNYRFDNMVPGKSLRVQFRDPTNKAVIKGTPTNNDQATGSTPGSSYSNLAGAASEIPATRDSLIVRLVPGNTLSNQSLPLDPAGVIYDSVSRQAIGGASVTLLRNGSPVPTTDLIGYATGATSNAQLTCGPEASAACPLPGAYQFLLQPSAPAGNYTLAVTAPNYKTSTTLLPAGPSYTPVGNPASVISINQANLSGNPPPQPGQDTTYYYAFNLSPNAAPGVVNNHIPLDPAVLPQLAISKTGDRSRAELGDSVRYTVVVRRTDAGSGFLSSVALLDTLPAGFKYIPGTLSVNSIPVSDAQASLTQPGVTLPMVINFSTPPLSTSSSSKGLAAKGTVTINYRVRLGAGAMQGTGVNRVQAKLGSSVNCAITPQACSNEAQFKVQVDGGVFTNQACMSGKVYMDCNHNQIQDPEELGIPGVRLYLNDGTAITSDIEGKYSLCDLPPRTAVLKLDPLTLPKGSRLVTSSSRNAGDAGSLFLDPKNGELIKADFIEGSCSNTVLEQVKARRTQGEVHTPESGATQTEQKGGRVLKFKGKGPGYPQEGTDSANQVLVKPRTPAPQTDTGQSQSELNDPVYEKNQKPKAASQGVGQ